jgi:NAD(P)-dependent dehydrogenase (short-subunit alcohol dehydrogenase family)
MASDRTILITGVTSKRGGAVAKALLAPDSVTHKLVVCRECQNPSNSAYVVVSKLQWKYVRNLWDLSISCEPSCSSADSI